VNKSHGLRRTNADKQRAVEAALLHPKSRELSDSQIARHVGVDHKTVSAQRSILGISQDSRTVNRNGTTYQQNTANIGKGKSPVSAEPGTRVAVEYHADYPPIPQRQRPIAPVHPVGSAMRRLH
jgi:hypothetical protein